MYIERQNGRRERRDRRVCNFFSFFSLLLADSWNNNFGLRSMTMPARENECSASVLGQIRLLPCVRANVNDDAWFLSRRSAPRMESSYDDDGKASYHWKWKLVNIRWYNSKSSQLIRKFATTQKVFFFFFRFINEVSFEDLTVKIWLALCLGRNKRSSWQLSIMRRWRRIKPSSAVVFRLAACSICVYVLFNLAPMSIIGRLVLVMVREGSSMVQMTKSLARFAM